MNLFITATGTGIGKSFVTAGLITAWRRSGRPVRALKPVMSGYEGEDLANNDAALLLQALGTAPSHKSIAAISPFRFAAPLSPDIAAAREGRAIDFAELVAFCRRMSCQPPGALFVEGVGGVMVPLTDRRTVLDWMADLGWPVLLVAGSYLGTISHTLTALAALRAGRLSVAALVLNETPDSPPVGETIATIARFAGGLPIVALPHPTDRHDPVFQDLIALIERHTSAASQR